MDGYMRLVRHIATGPARLAIGAQLGILRQEVSARSQSTMLPFLPLLQQHAATLVEGRPMQRDMAKAQITVLTRAEVQGAH